MADYPDWTSMVNIQGSQITFGFNLQAQEADLTVDIAAQTIESIKINITAQSVGVFLQADWAALHITDKNINGDEGDVAVDGVLHVFYEIPANTTFFACGMAFNIDGYLAADRDKNQIGKLLLGITGPPELIAGFGGNGGGGMTFSKPIAMDSGRYVDLQLSNRANHAVNLHASCWGYEIPD